VYEIAEEINRDLLFSVNSFKFTGVKMNSMSSIIAADHKSE